MKMAIMFVLLLMNLSCANLVEAQGEDAFLPTWKLLSSDGKKQFIAGYIQGLRDAGKITDIAISYVRNNPDAAISSLERIRDLYKTSSSPDVLVEGINAFYSDPKNMSASLAKAVNSVKSVIP